MNYTDALNALKTASLFDLFRLAMAISHELENPDRIKAVRLAFKVGDTVSFFDETANRVRSGVVVEKNLKYVSLQDGKDAYHFLKVPYCVLNLENVNTDIGCSRQEKLSKNNLRTGDCVGFNKDGEQITGTITRLNFKTVSLVTADQRRWRVGYAHLYKIIDTETEHAQHFSKLTSVLPKNNLTH